MVQCPSGFRPLGNLDLPFFQMYNRASKQFLELPFEAESYGMAESKGKGKGKGKGTSVAISYSDSFASDYEITVLCMPLLKKACFCRKGSLFLLTAP